MRFDLTASSTDALPEAPFPSDFYAAGANVPNPIAAKPGMVSSSMMPALLELGRFGTQQAVYFPLNKSLGEAAEIDAATLAARSGLLRVDAGEPAFHPAEVTLASDGKAIVLLPALGAPLQPGATYLAYVQTGAVPGLTANPGFQAVWKGDGAPRSGYVAALGEAVLRLSDLLAIDPENVAAATLFTVQEPWADIDKIAAEIDAMTGFSIVWDGPRYGSETTPVTALMGHPERQVPGRDIPGGMISGSIAEIRIGTLKLAAWSDSEAMAPFTYGADRRPLPKAMVPVQFLLVLPGCDRPEEGYPVVLAQHGLNDEKSFGLVVGEMMARECMAVLAIDAVAHGSRARRVRDLENIVTGEQVPDGLADLWNTANIDQLFLIRPLVARANLLDTVASWLQVERSVALGLWTETGGEPLFDKQKVGFIGQSMGGIVSAMFLGVSRTVSAGVVNVGGGNFTLIAEASALLQSVSPAFAALFLGDVNGRLDRWAFALSLLQGVMDGADPVNYAPRWAGVPELGVAPKRVLMQAAGRDQLIPNLSTAALAKAAGAVRVGNGGETFPLYGPPVHPLPHRVGAAAQGAQHAFLSVVDGADHLMINEECSFVDRQVDPPFAVVPRESIENPIFDVQRQAARFLASAFAGAPVIEAVSPAKVVGRDCEGLALAPN